MSFITEVFITDESINLVKYKEEINNYIGSIYNLEDPCSKRKEKLLNAKKEITSDIEILKEKIHVSKEVHEVDSLSLELENSVMTLASVGNLVLIHDVLIRVKEFLEKKKFIDAAQEIVYVEKCVNDIPKYEITDVILTLKVEIAKDKKTLEERLIRIFEKAVKIKANKPKIVQINSLKIKKNFNDMESLLFVLNSLENLTPLKNIGKLLWKHIFKPIINNNTCVKIEEDNNYHILNVVKRTPMKIHYKEVFNRIVEVFHFLKTKFYYKNKDFNSVNFLGNEIKFVLCESLLRDCLSAMVPVTDEMYHLYKEVINNTRRFQKELIKLEVFDATKNPLAQVVDDMDLMYINKMCNQYLGGAITIMKKDLQNSVFVGNPDDSEQPLKMNDFPECCISRSTLELIDLTGKLIQQAVHESTVSAGRLICTLQSIFYQYGNIVCGHNERQLQLVPKTIALFRNNCMYIAHQLIKFNKMYGKKFSSESLSDPLLFTDQAHQLRTLAGEIFLAYVEEHVRQMEITLEHCHLTEDHVSGLLFPDANEGIKLCLKQYEILKFVWRKILPISVFKKTLGYIINALCKRINDIILSVNHIPCKNAARLEQMFEEILTRAPKIFKGCQDIRVYVESWQKFNGIVFVLGATLEELNDSWHKGKGPLTLCFASDEMKSLVSALFVNGSIDF